MAQVGHGSGVAGAAARRRSLPGWVFPVALVLITAEIALAAGVLARPDSRPGGPTANPTATALAASDVAAINALLVTRSSALLRRDRDAFLAGVDPRGDRFRASQAALFANLADVPIKDLSFDAAPERVHPVPAGLAARYGARVWAGEVELRYALDGQPVLQRQHLTFVRRGERWYLGGDDDFRDIGLVTERALWDFGPVAAVRTRHALVLGHRGAPLDELAKLVDRAVPRVTAVWGPWQEKVVVLRPGDDEEAAALVPKTGDVRQLAAVTADGARIVVVPGPFGKLRADGRAVVMRHEITHVATRAVTSDATPYWLSEGFADYVAYAGEPDSPRQVARELAAEVRAGTVPDRLPGEASFAPDGQRLAQAYQESWLACRLVAERIGAQGLVRLYREVSAGPGDPDASLDSGLRSVLGLTTEQFVTLWREYVREQLHP